MLQSLDYSCEFPTTGRSFQNRIEFAPGLTAITGRNEQGKTLIMEMVGYALFGTDALRGLASDYRNLSALLNLMVSDQQWVLDRKPRTQTFTVDGEVVAVGAQAINAEVVKRLGFDLKVFNIACAAQQGDLGALTEMRPTARRQMVDQLIGLDLLENIEKECKTEAKTQETVAMSLASSMAEPIEPEKPEGYKSSADLEKAQAFLSVHEQERVRLLALREPVKPVEPVNPNLPPVEELEQHEADRQGALVKQAQLQGALAQMPVTTVSKADLQKAVDYASYKAAVQARGPKPVHSTVALCQFEAILDVQAKAAEEVACPKCDHHFHPGLSDADEQLLSQESPLTRTEISVERARIHNWAEPLAEVEPFELPNLQQEILAHARADDRRTVEDALQQLTIPVDRSADLRAARAYQSELAVYGARVGEYDRQLSVWQAGQARLRELPDRSGEAGDLARRLAEARNYEAALGRFDQHRAAYDELRGRVAAAREQADGFTNGATALRNTRVRVKQELAPSLSKAASSLLYTMTDGERRHVDVDHDFNITVDGQPLQTLSGSGKSVVNLALRIGLGQVLTCKVLPIFMGDEVDKDMDEVRAGATHATFQNLRNYLTQIIIVTHKEIEADQVITL